MADTLNRIAFRLVAPEWGHEWDLLPVIDGRSLVEVVEEATGGDYRARTARESLPPAKLLVGAEAPGIRVKILSCACCDLGCAAVGVRITREGERVRWSEFDEESQTGMVTALIADMGEFVFDRRQYASAIEDALAEWDRKRGRGDGLE